MLEVWRRALLEFSKWIYVSKEEWFFKKSTWRLEWCNWCRVCMLWINSALQSKNFREKKWLLSIATFVTFFKAFLLWFIVVLLRHMTNENVTISPFNNLLSPFHNNRFELWGSFSKYYSFFFIVFPKVGVPSKMEFLNFNFCLFLSVRTIRVLRSKGLICYLLFNNFFLFLSFPPFSLQ